jgi:hypothetical protein
MFEKQVAADAAKTKAELEAEEAEANRQWRQRQYFRQVLGAANPIGRQVDWSAMPDRRMAPWR